MTKLLQHLSEKAFQPLLMPLYASILPFFYSDIYFVRLFQSFRFLLLVAIAAYVFPALLAKLARQIYKNDPHSEGGTQFLPYICSFIFLSILLFYFSRLGMPIWYISLLVASSIVLLITGIFRIYKNMSGHLAGIGGLLGSTMGICYFIKGENPFMLFIFMFLVAGLLASLQLSSQKYTTRQVYGGFITGWLVAFVSSFLFLYIRIVFFS